MDMDFIYALKSSCYSQGRFSTYSTWGSCPLLVPSTANPTIHRHTFLAPNVKMADQPALVMFLLIQNWNYFVVYSGAIVMEITLE